VPGGIEPYTHAAYCFCHCDASREEISISYMDCDLAKRSTPDVSLSSRWRSPGALVSPTSLRYGA
jgi:hypothetical protein